MLCLCVSLGQVMTKVPRARTYDGRTGGLVGHSNLEVTLRSLEPKARLITLDSNPA